MSMKRQATTELNHENWDQEDPDEHEEMGSFKTASKDILEKRVIRTAKRRAPISDDEPKKSVFSGFGGFNKSQPSSFDFLSKLTNGSNSNGSSKTDTSTSSSLFTSKSPTSSQGTGLFGIPSSVTPSKTPFGTSSPQSSLFGVSSTNTTPTASVFTTSKPDSTVNDSPFKSQSVTSTSDKNTETKSTIASVPKFGIPMTSANISKSLFSSTTTTTHSNVFQIQPTTNTTSTLGISTKLESVPSDKKKEPEDSKNQKKMKYYSKLKGLNESVSNWIKKHVEQTPLCLLTPIFKDYENYLKEIQDEFHGEDNEEEKKKEDKNTSSEKKPIESTIKPTNETNKGSTLFNARSPTSNPLFATQNNTTTTAAEKQSFSFGITPTSNTSTTTTPGFSFGVTASNQPNVASSSPFSFSNNTTTNGAPSFSFGTNKPFSFNSNVQQTTEKAQEVNDEEDTPPKVEFTPVVEENSVFDKRCKVFVKKDGNFVDKGVGTLYIKKVEESGKHQLLIRANTNLGTILVNLILVSAIPTQRMGKNNVMMVCIPTPDAQPPPTPILIRVKTSEEADDLLETLNKYKT